MQKPLRLIIYCLSLISLPPCHLTQFWSNSNRLCGLDLLVSHFWNPFASDLHLRHLSRSSGSAASAPPTGSVEISRCCHYMSVYASVCVGVYGTANYEREMRDSPTGCSLNRFLGINEGLLFKSIKLTMTKLGNKTKRSIELLEFSETELHWQLKKIFGNCWTNLEKKANVEHTIK